MAGTVHRRPVIWATAFAIALTLLSAGTSRATTATSKGDCQNVTQPKIIYGTTPILFVHGINSDHSMWDGNTHVDGTNQNPLTYIQMALGRGQVTGYTFDWSKYSGLPPNGIIGWVTDRPPANLGDLLAQAITCVASHAGHKVIIIAHSMGGLLTEYASHVTQAAGDIAAVFTLGTPYQGSWLASAAIGQGPDKTTNDSIHALEALCPPQTPPANQPRPSPSLRVHRRPRSAIDNFITGYCRLLKLNERNDPGIVAMRLNPPQGGGWKKLPHPPTGLPWYPLAASVQGVWQPASPVRIVEPLNYVGDGVVSPTSQLAGGSNPTVTCQVDTTVRLRGRPVRQRQPWFLDAAFSPCFHIHEPYNKTLLDHIIGTIRSKHLIPTASISPHTKAPVPPPAPPQHWQQVRTLTDPTSGDIRNIAVSPAGDLLATCAFDGSSYLWNVTSGQLVATITPANSTGSVSSLAFSPDGKTLALGSGGGIVLRDVATMATVATINWPGNGGVSSLTFSPDGTMLAASDLGGNGAYLWDVATGSQIALLSTSIGADTAVAFSPDGKTLAVGGDNGTVLWNVATQHPIATLGTSGSGPIISAAFSPDGKTLATGGFTGAVLWNVATQQKIAVISNLRMPADTTAVSFSPDGALVATAGAPTALWAAPAGANVATLPTTSGSAAFSPHDLTLITTSGHSAIVWQPG